MSKNIKKLTFLLALILIFTTILVACSPADEESIDIKVMEVTHSLFYTPQYVALTQGFFEEEGLNIELIDGKGADKVMAALISGEVEIGFMGPEASVYIYNQGRDNYAINFIQLTQRDGSFLVSREPDKDFTWDKVKGKEVLGGRKGGMPLMTLEYVIKEHGMQIPEDLDVRTDVQFDVLAGAFVGGEGDYVSLFEPVASNLEKEGQGYVVASIGEAGGYIPYTAYSATKEYIEENDSPTIAQAVLPQFPETDIYVLEALIDRYKDQDSWKPDLIITEEGLDRMMDIMEEAGELDQRADYDAIVTTEFAEQAMKNIE